MVTPGVRVGWLGAGLIATFHSKMLRGSGVDAVWGGVYDPDTTRAERFAAASGADVRSSVEAVLEDCDAVYVCTWTSEHLALVTAAAERGVHVFVEKPLAPSLAEAHRLCDVVERAGVVNQVGLVLRRSPAYLLVRALVADPDAGRLMSFVFRDDQFLPISGWYDSQWRADVERAGGGTMIEHSIHDVDLVEHVLGPVARVSAHQANFHGHEGIEDVVSATLSLDGGATGALVSVWHDVEARPSTRRLEVFCERRHVVVENDWYGPVTWTDAAGPPVTVEGVDLAAVAAERGIEDRNPDGDFVSAVAAGAPASPSVVEALRAHEVVDAIYRSCVDGAAVDVVNGRH